MMMGCVLSLYGGFSGAFKAAQQTPIYLLLILSNMEKRHQEPRFTVSFWWPAGDDENTLGPMMDVIRSLITNDNFHEMRCKNFLCNRNWPMNIRILHVPCKLDASKAQKFSYITRSKEINVLMIRFRTLIFRRIGV